MKVKKFRIRPRMPSVGRILKGLLQTKQLDLQVEASLPAESENFLKQIVPTAFYQTWSNDDMPIILRPLSDQYGLDKAVAVTLMAATVGASAEEYLSELLMNGETTRSQVVSAIAEESVDLSLQFLIRLLTDEANGDDCDVTEAVLLSDPVVLKELLPLLEAENEGISIDSAQHLSPRFTRVALIAWVPLSRKKKLQQSPLKKKFA
ncbi:MAG: hypothetical protein ACKVQC_06425 [Elusimicrobiota bacterium]